jgi:hypothetical protein
MNNPQANNKGCFLITKQLQIISQRVTENINLALSVLIKLDFSENV